MVYLKAFFLLEMGDGRSGGQDYVRNGGGSCSKRTRAYDGGRGGQILAILLCTY